MCSRRRAEGELGAAQEELRQLLAHNPGVLYRLKVDGETVTPVTVSDNISHLLGCDLNENFTYDWWSERLHSDDRDRAAASIPETLTNGESRTEYRLRDADGSYKWVDDNRRLLRDESGQPTEIIGLWIDITERKDSEALLHESEARLRLAVEASNIGLWDWNVLTGAVYFSPEWKGQLGYAEDEIADSFSEWESRVHSDDLGPASAVLTASLEDPNREYDVEFRMKHKDGSYRWIQTRAKVFRDNMCKPVRVLGCHVDITERKSSEESLRETEERLQAALSSGEICTFSLDFKT